MEDQQYQQERQAAIDAEFSDAEHYDKWLLTLSGGALGISIAFLKDIAKTPDPATLPCLITAWACLIAAIAFTIASLQFSQAGFRRYRENLDKQQNGNPVAAADNILVRIWLWFTGGNISARIVLLLNWLSLFLFVAGISALAAFSFQNLPRD